MHTELHVDQVAPVLGEWESLFRNDPAASPFMSAEWARAWSTHWADSGSPWLVAVREGDRLIGLAPFVLRQRGPFRVLAAFGRDPGNYWDVLAEPGKRSVVAAAIADVVAEHAAEWDAVALGGVPVGAPINSALEHVGLRKDRRTPVPYPGIELPRTFDEYLGGLRRSHRTNLRRHLRRLDEGVVELRELKNPSEIAEAVDRWQDLRIRWWRERGRHQNPEHASSRFRGFLRDLMQLMVPAGLGLVWEFRHRSEVVGVELSLVTERCFYYWLGGYEVRAARFGIGKTSVGHGIRSSISAGRSYFDFMVGAESYKYWFGATDRYCEWVMLTSRAPRSRMARLTGKAAGVRRRQPPSTAS